MGYKLSVEEANVALKELSKKYKIYAPRVFKGEGTFSDTDRVRYGEISNIEEIEFNKKSEYSFKEALQPISQTILYFTEDSMTEASVEEKPWLIFLRSCDMYSVRVGDDIYLRNGFEDIYYKKIREKCKFILISCDKSYENCFCVSMGTNKATEYDAYIKLQGNKVYFDVKDEEIEDIIENLQNEKLDVKPNYIEENEVTVNIPENLSLEVMKSKMWDEYKQRCIACGRCTFACPTCTCFTMQDMYYKENKNSGERRRVWASCHVDRYTEMAGGHSFREDRGQRMRFKTLHKVYDYKKRFGYNMCVGCGRCDDICPEYISFSTCINKLEDAMNEVK